MLITLLSAYLVYVIFASLFIIFMILRAKLAILRLVLLATLILIVFPAAAGYFYVVYVDSLPSVAIPDLRGMELPLAMEKLDQLQLNGVLAGSTYDMQIPLACVVTQQPEAGRMVKVGRTVKLVTSSGRRKIPAPSLLGKTLGEAEEILKSQGLSLGQVEYNNTHEMDAGLIVLQLPLPDEEIESGGMVNITIATKEGQTEEQKKEEGGFRIWPF
ncbi:MAG: PASTA domain-containing protein [Candidatus Margulisbacteria bacterium]|nr:PASTA domain-containing protein [Candidatus Margulisiibacteriota bacterium]